MTSLSAVPQTVAKPGLAGFARPFPPPVLLAGLQVSVLSGVWVSCPGRLGAGRLPARAVPAHGMFALVTDEWCHRAPLGWMGQPHPTGLQGAGRGW